MYEFKNFNVALGDSLDDSIHVIWDSRENMEARFIAHPCFQDIPGRRMYVNNGNLVLITHRSCASGYNVQILSSNGYVARFYVNGGDWARVKYLANVLSSILK